jgi:hypothetical protein
MANSWVLRTAQRWKYQFLARTPQQHKASTAGKLSSHSGIAISGTYGEGRGRLFLIQPVLFAKHENPQVKVHEDGIFGVGFVVGQAELGRDKCERCVGLRCCDGDNRGRSSSTEERNQMMQRVLQRGARGRGAKRNSGKGAARGCGERTWSIFMKALTSSRFMSVHAKLGPTGAVPYSGVSGALPVSSAMSPCSGR